MFVAKYPDFLAEVIFKDGSYAVFGERHKQRMGKSKTFIDKSFQLVYKDNSHEGRAPPEGGASRGFFYGKEKKVDCCD